MIPQLHDTIILTQAAKLRVYQVTANDRFDPYQLSCVIPKSSETVWDIFQYLQLMQLIKMQLKCQN